MAVVKVRFIWLLLVLMLLQAWGAVSHVHGPVERGAASVVLADAMQAEARQITATGIGDAEHDPESAETTCCCTWCAPRLHTLLAYALPRPEPPPAATAMPILALPPTRRLPDPPEGAPLPRGPPA